VAGSEVAEVDAAGAGGYVFVEEVEACEDYGLENLLDVCTPERQHVFVYCT
jgi:hypothetical protein